MGRKEGIYQETVTTQGAKERGVTEPGQPWLGSLAADEIDVRIGDGRGWTWRLWSTPSAEPIGDPPTQDRRRPMWTVGWFQI